MTIPLRLHVRWVPTLYTHPVDHQIRTAFDNDPTLVAITNGFCATPDGYSVVDLYGRRWLIAREGHTVLTATPTSVEDTILDDMKG